MRALLVTNPQATTTTPGTRDVLAHALASAVKLDLVETGYRGHAADAAAQARADGLDLVVALGGDGTVNEVVNGLLRDGTGDDVPMLAVVPGGSANVFARALGISREPVEATYQVLQALEARRSRSVGLGRVDDRWFTFNAGLGWDADVVRAVERQREAGRVATPLRYARIAFDRYLRSAMRKPSLTVELPGREPITGCHLTFVSNTTPWTYLGPYAMHTNPDCSFDSGLGVFALDTMRAPTVLRHLAQVFGGRPAGPRGARLLREDDVASLVVRCDRPMGLQVDGDFLGLREKVRFNAAPKALEVVA
ncbi:diacylglycerol kinase family enzyme [Actinoalloteichus hoggarensis]|uniref:diacylglycerol/lipid kinase family protein n=1 Tax=Actinoalloteichus hoggarensis TaxID=1470176 RepID=UPI000B8AAACC|nr:diacylglycerol kinase family protein [Actinoalloteichus hoggarensis]MBB5923104.1 diacylglycerol kinase family enzyme [Actinoalloteichus hoggarensis]